MGLAIAQIQLLSLTWRQNDISFDIFKNNQAKSALLREQSKLTQEYNNRLNSNNIYYYDDGKYNMVNYQYLMGYGSNYLAIMEGDHQKPIKEDMNMILCDSKGRTVLSQTYANAILSVTGGSMDANGRGGTFSRELIPQIIANLCPGFSAENIKKVMDEEALEYNFSASAVNTQTLEETGNTAIIENGVDRTAMYQSIVNFYYPIFLSASSNGWTTEYNSEMSNNPSYINDAIVTGTFRLMEVDFNGNYDRNSSLAYYISSGALESKLPSEEQKQITSWYTSLKDLIAEKENEIDVENEELNTELSTISSQIESLKSYLENAVQSIYGKGGGA